MTHSVLDKFGERLCEGTREYCEEMIWRMKWREVMITKYLKKPSHKKHKRVKLLVKSPRDKEKIPRRERPVIVTDQYGRKQVFSNVKQVCNCFDASINAVFSAINRGQYGKQGSFKGVKLQWGVEV